MIMTKDRELGRIKAYDRCRECARLYKILNRSKNELYTPCECRANTFMICSLIMMLIAFANSFQSSPDYVSPNTKPPTDMHTRTHARSIEKPHKH